MNDLISKQFSKGFGCNFEPPQKEDAKFGRFFPLKGIPVDWRQYLPQGERQGNSFFCTSFAYLNCIETMLRRGGENFNFSDRWNAVRAKTTPDGNTIDNVCHAGLHEGNVKEEECPFNEEWLENPNTYWDKIQDIENLKPVIYPGPNYSSVRFKELKSALAYSPIIIGVYVGDTWGQEVITKPKETYGGHAVELAYIDDYIYIFDSYPPFLKKLSLDYPIIVAKSLAKLSDNWKEVNLRDQITLMQKIINLMRQLIDMIIKQKKDPESLPAMPSQTPTTPPEASKPVNRINDIGLAIKAYEGWISPCETFPFGSRSFRNKNPGNIKFTSYSKYYLKAIGKDKNNFCIFETEGKGFWALCELLKDAFTGQLAAYRNCKTLKEFFSVYAPANDNNYPDKYAKYVAKRTGIDVNFPLKELA